MGVGLVSKSVCPHCFSRLVPGDIFFFFFSRCKHQGKFLAINGATLFFNNYYYFDAVFDLKLILLGKVVYLLFDANTPRNKS